MLMWPVRCFTCNNTIGLTWRLRLFQELQETDPPVPMHMILERIGLSGREHECCSAVVQSTVPTDVKRPMIHTLPVPQYRT